MKSIFITYEDVKSVSMSEMPLFLAAIGLAPSLDYTFKFTTAGVYVKIIEWKDNYKVRMKS